MESCRDLRLKTSCVCSTTSSIPWGTKLESTRIIRLISHCKINRGDNLNEYSSLSTGFVLLDLCTKSSTCLHSCCAFFSSFLTGGTTCSGYRVTNCLYGIVLIDGQAKYNSSTLNNQGTGAGQSTGSGGARAGAPASVGRARTRPYGAPHGAAQLDSLKLYQDKPPHAVTCGVIGFTDTDDSMRHLVI